MFGRKKTVYNEVFGEMIQWTTKWEAVTKLKLTLWNKTYDIDLCANTRSKEDGINENQEIAYKNFKETILERQKEIEKTVENYLNIRDEQRLSSKFIPTELLFSRKGECALYAEDGDVEYGLYHDDPNAGFVVSINPWLKVFLPEEYDMYLYGGGTL